MWWDKYHKICEICSMTLEIMENVEKMVNMAENMECNYKKHGRYGIIWLLYGYIM
jgi:hypothetical protein